MPQLRQFRSNMFDLGKIERNVQDIKTSRTRNALLESQAEVAGKQAENYDTDRNYLMKKRGWEQEDRTRAVEKHKFQDELDALNYVYKAAPMISYDNYNDSKKHFEELGLNPDLLPPIEKFGPVGSPEARKTFEEGKPRFLLSVDNQIKLLEKSKKNKSQVTIYGPGGKTARVAVDKTEDYVPPKGWSLKKPDKAREPRRPSVIKKDIVNLEKSRQEIINTGAVGGMAFSLISMTNPEMAEKIQASDPQRAVEAIDDAIQELLKELPAGSKPPAKPTKELTFDAATGQFK